MGKHNHKAIFTAVVLDLALTYVWYSPTLFLKKWEQALGLSFDQIKTVSSLSILASILSSILFCYLLSWIFQIAVIEEWKDGLATGLLVGVGFIAPAIISHYMYLGLHSDVILIDASREVLSAGITGILLATWRAERTPEDARGC
jgi:hypothetical protein